MRSDNPQALADAVRMFYSLSSEERQIMGANGRRTVTEEYGRERLVGQVADMLESAVSSRKRK